tara:strand:- start:710 stop:835 length:126 start_codon:yes stop_codon:yes gene_type:complete
VPVTIGDTDKKNENQLTGVLVLIGIMGLLMFILFKAVKRKK